MKVLLDSNILLRLAEPSHMFYPSVMGALELLRDQSTKLFVVPQNLYEYWAVATRPAEHNGLGFSIHRAQTDLDEICQIFDLLRDERAILSQWQSIVVDFEVRGRNVYDARLVAAMQRHQLSHLLTLDASDFKRYDDITVLTPDAVLA